MWSRTAADQGRWTLTLSGAVDLASQEGLRGAIETMIWDGLSELVVDLREVEVIDSTGLGLLVWIRKRVREAGGRLALASGEGRARRALELTGLLKLFDVYPSPEAAWSGLSHGAP